MAGEAFGVLGVEVLVPFGLVGLDCLLDAIAIVAGPCPLLQPPSISDTPAAPSNIIRTDLRMLPPFGRKARKQSSLARVRNGLQRT